ncbi:MAG: uracil phosphoribosyltransferase [Oscillospiraceae bacterium]|nr:uracil phosphoribosyltransferase [Oscillospiraceae bacterium]
MSNINTEKFHILDHPQIQHKISLMRDKTTISKEFRELTAELALLMTYEATRDLPLKEVEVQTPIALAKAKVLSGRKLALVPILRAGLGMLEGAVSLIPAAKVGHIGVCRTEDKKGVHDYYCKLPVDIAQRDVIVMDLMLATGNCAIEAINKIKQAGSESVKFIVVIACPEGVEAMQKSHPDVEIFCGALDDGLNEDLYVVPGFGDGGDRIFGTK